MSDVLKIQPSARVKIIKNNEILVVDQNFSPISGDFSRHAGQGRTIPPSGSVQLDVAGISVVRNFLFQSDTKCTVRFNGQASGVPLTGTQIVHAVYAGSITQIDVDNDHTTNIATIQYLVSD